MNEISFTTINHVARKNLGLSMNEYAVADLIYHLANNPKNPSQWCYASKQTIRTILDLSEKTVYLIINRLINLNLVEKHEETKYLRVTSKWYEEVVTVKITDGLYKLQDSTVKITVPIYDNNNYNNKEKYKRESKNSNLDDNTDLSNHTHISYLSNIPLEELGLLLERFSATKRQILSKADDLANYCRAKGKVYKNYHALLINALKRDFGEKTTEPETRAGYKEWHKPGDEFVKA